MQSRLPNALETQPGNGFSIDAGLWKDGDARLKQSGVTREVGSQNTSITSTTVLCGATSAAEVPLMFTGQFRQSAHGDRKDRQHEACIADGSYSLRRSATNPRLAIVPRFVEIHLGTASDIASRSSSFEPIYLNELYFNCNGSDVRWNLLPRRDHRQALHHPAGKLQEARRGPTQQLSYSTAACSRTAYYPTRVRAGNCSTTRFACTAERRLSTHQPCYGRGCAAGAE